MKIKGLLFDMDGVLVDSEPTITRAAIEGLSHYGVSAKREDFKEFTGMGEVMFIGGVARKYGKEYAPEMKTLVYEIYLDLVDESLVVYEDTLKTLAALKASGVKMALASSADHIKISANLRVAAIPDGTFDAVIGAEDAEKKKPAPDIYLTAAKRIGVPPELCAVVEDAISGVKAGKAAGAFVVAITTSFREADLLAAGADAVITRLGELPRVLASAE